MSDNNLRVQPLIEILADENRLASALAARVATAASAALAARGRFALQMDGTFTLEERRGG